MLIYVHWAWVTAGITARNIIPHVSCARCKPYVEGVEEDAVGVIWVNSDALIVPVLRIIHATVSERAALRALHITPARAAVCRSPRTKLASVGATTAVVIPNDRLRLCVDVVRVTRCDCDIDAPELIGAATTGSIAATNRIVARRATTGIHGRTRRVRAAGHLVTEHKPISIACD